LLRFAAANRPLPLWFAGEEGFDFVEGGVADALDLEEVVDFGEWAGCDVCSFSKCVIRFLGCGAHIAMHERHTMGRG